MENGTSFDFFPVFIDNRIWDKIVDETNFYADQCVTDELIDVSENSKLHAWVPGRKADLMKLFGLLDYMGLVKLLSLRDYWSPGDLYKNNVASSTMLRNRFEILLSILHFSNNKDLTQSSSRVQKIQPLLDVFIKNCQLAYTPERVFCIDKRIIPLRGKLIIKQYTYMYKMV